MSVASQVNYEELRFWLALSLGVINLLGTAGVGVYAWIVAQSKNSSQHIKALESVLTEKIGEFGGRLAKVESHMNYMPSPQQLSEMQGDVRELAAIQKLHHEANLNRMQSMNATLVRVEDYLLEARK